MKTLLISALFAFTSLSALSQTSNACLPTQGTVDNVAYSAVVSHASLFPAFSQVTAQSTDPSVVAFRITAEFADGSKSSVIDLPQKAVIVTGEWCQIVRLTIESLKVDSIHQVR